MKRIDDILDSLSKTGLTRYTDDEGKIHFTTKSLEQLEKEKEEKLTYEKGPICSICNKRSKNFKIDINKDILCNKCYDKTWEETSVDEQNIVVNVTCPFCGVLLNLSFLNEDDNGEICECGAIYKQGYEDEFYYIVRFYKQKRRDTHRI